MIANWRLPPGFFREGFFLGVTLVGCGVKLVFWIAREACGSKRPVFDIPLAEYQTCLPTRPCRDAECVDARPNRDVEGGKEINLIS
jgi:hypothetical protein